MPLEWYKFRQFDIVLSKQVMESSEVKFCWPLCWVALQHFFAQIENEFPCHIFLSNIVNMERMSQQSKVWKYGKLIACYANNGKATYGRLGIWYGLSFYASAWK